jgi:SNF2 family DNA or RNA helicase
LLELRPYQRIGAEWLASRFRALLADDMGVGKTPQAIAACDLADVRTVLVFCPGIARENWRREFMAWQKRPREVCVIRGTGDLRAARAMCSDVLICSYALLASPKARKWLQGMRYDALICDEAHALKEPRSVCSRAIYGHRFDQANGLARLATRVWLLTGTPVLNHPGELWTHMRALWPAALANVGLRRDDFLYRFCRTDGEGRIVGARHQAELSALLRPHVLRRLSSDVQAELPPLQWAHVTVSPDDVPPPPPEFAEAVAVLEAAMAKAAGDDEAMAIAAAESMHLATLRRWTGVAKAAAVAELIRQDFASGMDSVVVFAIHRDVMATIAKGLGSNVGILSGDTKPADRQWIIDAFQAGTIRALVCQIDVASTALTLHRAHNAVFAESPWVPAILQQAAKRLHRYGQTRPVLARIVSLAGSLDETIARVVARKAAMLAEIELAKP